MVEVDDQDLDTLDAQDVDDAAEPGDPDHTVVGGAEGVAVIEEVDA